MTMTEKYGNGHILNGVCKHGQSSQEDDLKVQEIKTLPKPGNNCVDSLKAPKLPPDIGNKLSGPVQPIFFPKCNSINSSTRACWYEQHDWITYSYIANKVYCYPCIFFNVHGANHTEKVFTKQGFNDWDNAVGDLSKGLDQHANSNEHLKSVILWNSFAKHKVSVVEQLAYHRPRSKDRRYKFK